jgi:hypothetical protein
MENLFSSDQDYQSKVPLSFSPIKKARVINNEFVNLNRFLCKLCKNILINMKKCNMCNSHFCEECILGFKKETQGDYCPECHMNFKLEEGEIYLAKFLSELQIECTFKSKGCEEICFYQNLLEHESICKYREKKCENCNAVFDFNEYYSHLINCFQLLENYNTEIRQKKILSLIKAFDEKISKIKYENKYGINSLKMEMQRTISKLEDKIRILEKYVSEQDYLIRVSGLEKYKMNSALAIYGKNFKECQIYYHCRGGYNGCSRTGNVWGSNPYTSDSVICLAALHSGHLTKEGGLFVVKRGGSLDSYVGSVKNGISSQSYGSFDHMLILPSELDIKLTFSSQQCGPRVGVCRGKNNNCIEKGDVWGDNPYVRESNLCKAALHSGLITENGGIFMIEETGSHGGYLGTTRNGITSLPCSSNRASILIKPFLPY